MNTDMLPKIQKTTCETEHQSSDDLNVGENYDNFNTFTNVFTFLSKNLLNKLYNLKLSHKEIKCQLLCQYRRKGEKNQVHINKNSSSDCTALVGPSLGDTESWYVTSKRGSVSVTMCEGRECLSWSWFDFGVRLHVITSDCLHKS